MLLQQRRGTHDVNALESTLRRRQIRFCDFTRTAP